MKKTLAILLIAISSIVFAGGFAEDSAGEGDSVFHSLEDFNRPGIHIGVNTGSVFEELVQRCFPNAEIAYYNSLPDMAYQVMIGNLDCCTADEPVARLLARNIPGITYFPELMDPVGYAFVFPKTEKGLYLSIQVSDFISRIKSDGTLDAIISAWVDGNIAEQITDYSSLTGENGVIHYGAEFAFEPFTFLRNNEYVGIDMDILIRFCRENGYRIELHDMIFAALIPSLGTLCDMGGSGISVTEERKETVYFSEPYYDGGTVMVIRAPKEAKTSFWASCRESFEKTFLHEERWKLIVRGIGTTVYISVFAALIGTVLGFGLCLLRRLKNPVIHALTTVYIRILQGTPLVVLLMILFYVVFAGSGVSGEWVAIFAFALNFAAYVGEIFLGGINTVDRGQVEAASAIGFTRRSAFFRIIMPQAVKQCLPVYKGEFISLIKMTSIVGYIAVQDLTKMSDIIRGRTYEAFFPLITTALIYFALSALLASLLMTVDRRVTPNRKIRRIKGVTLK